MAAFRMEATLVGRRSLDSPVSCGSHRQLFAVAAPSSRRFQVLTSFSGQRFSTQQAKNYPILNRRVKTTVANAHQHGNGTVGPGLQGTTEHIMDDLSRYIYFKLRGIISPYIPPGFDALGWLPEEIHSKVHKGEAAAIILLREILHFSFFYFLFSRVDSICKWFHWLYLTNTKSKEVSEETYLASSFHAMANPLRFLIVVWATTRIAHISAPMLNLELGVTAMLRAVALIVAITWFCFKWKELYVDKLTTTYKIDAPRILAFDKVVSLLFYFVAASCIGDVTGFGLRSLLAVGGFSGVALGLAAKEMVSNFFGGALLFITRPFVIGERIKTGNFSGYVQDIGFLQTKILSIDRMPMVVPNQNFINQVITNYSRASNKLMEAEFSVRLQDIFRVDRITTRVVEYLRTHPDVDALKSTPLCYLQSVSAMDAIISVKCVLRHSGGSEFYKVQQSILVHVAGIITSEGAGIGNNAPFSSEIAA